MYDEYKVYIQYMDNHEDTIICNGVHSNNGMLRLVTYQNDYSDYKLFSIEKSIGVVLSNVRYYKSERVVKEV